MMVASLADAETKVHVLLSQQPREPVIGLGPRRFTGYWLFCNDSFILIDCDSEFSSDRPLPVPPPRAGEGLGWGSTSNTDLGHYGCPKHLVCSKLKRYTRGMGAFLQEYLNRHHLIVADLPGAF